MKTKLILLIAVIFMTVSFAPAGFANVSSASESEIVDEFEPTLVDPQLQKRYDEMAEMGTWLKMRKKNLDGMVVECNQDDALIKALVYELKGGFNQIADIYELEFESFPWEFFPQQAIGLPRIFPRYELAEVVPEYPLYHPKVPVRIACSEDDETINLRLKEQCRQLVGLASHLRMFGEHMKRVANNCQKGSAMAKELIISTSNYVSTHIFLYNMFYQMFQSGVFPNLTEMALPSPRKLAEECGMVVIENDNS